MELSRRRDSLSKVVAQSGVRVQALMLLIVAAADIRSLVIWAVNYELALTL